MHIILLPILKLLFVHLGRLKILKDPIEEDPPNVASEISHILFIYSNFIWYFFYKSPIIKVSCV